MTLQKIFYITLNYLITVNYYKKHHTVMATIFFSNDAPYSYCQEINTSEQQLLTINLYSTTNYSTQSIMSQLCKFAVSLPSLKCYQTDTQTQTDIRRGKGGSKALNNTNFLVHNGSYKKILFIINRWFETLLLIL